MPEPSRHGPTDQRLALPIVLDWNAVNSESDYEIVYIDVQCKNLLPAHII